MLEDGIALAVLTRIGDGILACIVLAVGVTDISALFSEKSLVES